MSMQNALDFIKMLDVDDFRKSLYSINGIDDFNTFLAEKDLVFNQAEFEDAYNKLLFKAQFAEQHDSLVNKAALLALITSGK